MKASASKEAKLVGWSKPPSATEIEKCERAERMVKQAIEADPKLSKMNISVYAKGSYANRTNIPSDSDVDVAVVVNNFYYNDYPPGKTYTDFGLISSNFTFQEFKSDVAQAIVNKFGRTEVEVSDNCVKVRSNTSRVDADVVPHFTHRRYRLDGAYESGVALINSQGKTIYNWPQQDYDNGVAKNDRTGRRYKGLVRILKTLRGEMTEAGYSSATKIPSYLVSCLAWNVPDGFFEEETYEKIVGDAIDFLIEKTSELASVKEWGEVNELKYLFGAHQKWQHGDVHQFLVDAKKFFGNLS